ncbi:MAG TPA: type II secretion system F family protein [Patescibacteria group bacterium]
MTRYAFKAKDWNGKTVRGTLDVGTKEEVIESIKQGGLVPLEINQEQTGMVQELIKNVLGKVGLKQVSTFTRQLSTMMTAGLPLTDALSLLKNQTETSSKMFEILDNALTTVRGGQSLARALEKYQNIFGEAYIASLDAGEEGGVLEEVLSKLADSLENQAEFQGKVKGAMIYPVIVIIGMVIVTFIMMIFVIPKLTSLYTDFGAKMPAITQALMDMSSFMAKTWFMFPLVIFGVMSIMKAGDRNPEFRLKRDTYKMKIPILGELTTKTIVAETMRTLSMLLGAGISLVDALKIVAKVADNELYYRAFTRISERVQKGFSIANSFEEVGVFPIIVNQMVATGEATGKLDEVLKRVADYFSTEAEQSVKSLTSAIEPLIMIVLGIGVGFLVVAVIMPIYNLTSSF